MNVQLILISYNHYSLHEPNIDIDESSIKSKTKIKEKKEILAKSLKKANKKVAVKKTAKKKEIAINSSKKKKSKEVQNKKEEVDY